MQFIRITNFNTRFHITLNRSDKFNALNSHLLSELIQTIGQLSKKKECRLIVLESNGAKAFCSGVDLDEMRNFKSASEAQEFARLLDQTILTLLKCSKPIISIIDGLAFGGGYAIASATDIRIGTEKTKISFPAGRIGAVLPPVLTHILNKIIGVGISRDLLLTGRIVDSKEAHELKLINRIVKSEELKKQVKEIEQQLLNSSEMALSMSKSFANQALIDDIQRLSMTDTAYFGKLFTQGEWRKRIDAIIK